MGDEPEAQQKQECGGTQGGVGPKMWTGAAVGVWGEWQWSFALHQRHVRVADRGAQEVRHREASGGGSGATSIPQPALSLPITGSRAGNMMEGDDKTTAEEIKDKINRKKQQRLHDRMGLFFFPVLWPFGESPARP